MIRMIFGAILGTIALVTFAWYRAWQAEVTTRPIGEVRTIELPELSFRPLGAGVDEAGETRVVREPAPRLAAARAGKTDRPALPAVELVPAKPAPRPAPRPIPAVVEKPSPRDALADVEVVVREPAPWEAELSANGFDDPDAEFDADLDPDLDAELDAELGEGLGAAVALEEPPDAGESGALVRRMLSVYPRDGRRR